MRRALRTMSVAVGEPVSRALVGQAAVHAPQLVHRSGSMVKRPMLREMASCGHAFMQTLHLLFQLRI